MRRWWSRARSVPADADADWRRSIAQHPGRPARVLAWTVAAGDTLVILSPAALSVRADGGDWHHVGWHEIQRGGWNRETEQLTWHTYDGPRGAVTLADPARVPEVFKERIDATMMLERFVPITTGGDRGVVVSARRSLAEGPTEISWHTTLTRGVTWRTPGITELADAALADLRREYDEP